MAIAFTNLGATANPDLESDIAGLAFTNASSSPPASGLVFLFVHSDRAAGDVTQPTISGTNGWNLTWTFIVGLAGVGTSQGQFLFATSAAGGSGGTITVDYGANIQAGFSSSLFYADGTDVANGVAQCFVQTKTGTAAATTTPSLVMDNAALNAANRPIAYFYNNGGEIATPRTNWTEMDDWGGTARAVETQIRSDAFEQTSSATTGTNRNWFMLSAEIKAASTARNLSILGAGT